MMGPVLCEDADGVRRITLNRPTRRNAIDMAMIRALESALVEAQDMASVRVILLRGAGPSFCAGDDVDAQVAICANGEAALRDQLRRLQSISTLLTLGDKLTLAAVRGWAVGAGFSWVLNCDFRLWGEGAGGFFPELGFGTFVTGGASFLAPRLVGEAAARDLLYLGRRTSAREPWAAGLVSAVHADDVLDAEAEQAAVRLAQLSSIATHHMKRALTRGWEANFRTALDYEVEACVETILDPDTLARMRAAVK